MIFDTNVLIYISNLTLDPKILFKITGRISVITKIECLGYAFKDTVAQLIITELCQELEVIPLTDSIAEQTILIRANNKIKLADALIYATALTSGVPSITNNIRDFKSLPYKVELINPFDL